MFLDIALFSLFNGIFRNRVFDVLLPLFSDIRLLWLILLFSIGIYALYCKRRFGESLWRVVVLALFLGLSILAAQLAATIINDSTERRSPAQVISGTYYYTQDHEWTIISEPDSEPDAVNTDEGSFPSSLAATTMAAVLVISLLFRQMNPWVYFIPLLVGWSRIYLGAHYPLDVFCGWLFGALSVLAVWWLCQIVFARLAPNHRHLSPPKTAKYE